MEDDLDETDSSAEESANDSNADEANEEEYAALVDMCTKIYKMQRKVTKKVRRSKLSLSSRIR